MTKAFVSCDSFSVAQNGDAVARRLKALGYDVVEVGSHGLSWLEPLIEFESNGQRIAFGPIRLSDLSVGQETISKPWNQSHDRYLGDIREHPFLRSQRRLVFDRIARFSPDEVPPQNDFVRALAMSPAEILKEVEMSGLRGRGGAGFPAHIKWQTVADTPSDQKYIVCNADEGDSGTFADRLLMEGDPFRLIEGMVISGYAVGATHGIIYLRSEYPLAYRYLQAAIDAAYEAGWLGDNILDTGIAFDLEIFVGAGAYICGEETSLLESLEGKRGQIRAKPPVPAVAGLFQRPTLVHNVITLAAVPGILDIGGDGYRQLGEGPSTGTMTFQLAGNVRHGGLVEIPFGMPIGDFIEEYGGGTYSGRPMRAVQIGGPLGAYLSEYELKTPLTYEAMAEVGAGIGHGGIVVFDESVDLVEQAEYAFRFCEVESCGKCTPCRVGATRGKELMQRFSRNEGTDESTILVKDLCDVMERASLCQMGGMTPIPVLSAMERFPEDFAEKMKPHATS